MPFTELTLFCLPANLLVSLWTEDDVFTKTAESGESKGSKPNMEEDSLVLVDSAAPGGVSPELDLDPGESDVPLDCLKDWSDWFGLVEVPRVMIAAGAKAKAAITDPIAQLGYTGAEVFLENIHLKLKGLGNVRILQNCPILLF